MALAILLHFSSLEQVTLKQVVCVSRLENLQMHLSEKYLLQKRCRPKLGFLSAVQPNPANLVVIGAFLKKQPTTFRQHFSTDWSSSHSFHRLKATISLKTLSTSLDRDLRLAMPVAKIRQKLFIH
jgi:hypothetical protein